MLSLCLLCLSATAYVVPAAALMVLAGFALMMLVNNANVAIQSNVNDQFRGRVMALYVTVAQGSTPVGAIVAGALAEAWGLSAAFIAGGILTLLASVVVWMRLRVLGRQGRLGETRIPRAAQSD